MQYSTNTTSPPPGITSQHHTMHQGMTHTPPHPCPCRHEAWEKYQSACLVKAAAPHSSASSHLVVVSEAGLSRATLGDAIKAGQQQRIIARWEQQQRQWAGTEALLAARVGRAGPEDLAMSRGEGCVGGEGSRVRYGAQQGLGVAAAGAAGGGCV
jgi:hypothetical protein